MASSLRMPAALAAAFSIGLNLAIIGTAGRTLHVFQNERDDNPFFLPIWTSHFDMRGLHALIATSAIIVVLNGILALALFLSALPTNVLSPVTSALSTIISIIAISFPSVLNNRAPHRDTLQSWTCLWKDMAGNEVPSQFGTLCHETRFAFYTTIPSFILQLTLLGFAIYTLLGRGSLSKRGRKLDDEKEHELVERQQHSCETKSISGSLRRTPMNVQVIAGKQ